MIDNNGRKKSKSELLVVAGLSNTGKSLVIQCLEDVGYLYVDSLSPVLLPKFVGLMEQGNLSLRRVTIVVDLGDKGLSNPLVAVMDKVKNEGDVIINVMLLEASTEKLVSRYKGTCRVHPLMGQGKRSLINAINDEREHLSQARSIANFIIDTAKLSPEKSKERIRRCCKDEEFKTFTINVTSFGFKHGTQMDADLVLGVRLLPNLHYVVDLRPLTRLDEDVYNYIMKWKGTETFFEELTSLLDFTTSGYKKEGKSQLVTAIGCTGGQHWSIASIERLGNYLNEVFEYNIHVYHKSAYIESGERK